MNKIIKAWEHKNWGNNLQAMDWEKGKMVAWLTPHPEIGDEVWFKLQSGKIGAVKITKVEPCGNPSDMVFFDCEEIGYVEDRELKLEERRYKITPSFVFGQPAPCDHVCSGNCRREGCNCICGEWHEVEPPDQDALRKDEKFI